MPDQRPSEHTMWDRLVVSLEFADLSDPDTCARLDNAAAAANNRGLQAATAWTYAQALPMLTAAIEIWARLERVPGEIGARNTRGNVYRKLGDYEAAATDHKTALVLANDHDLIGGEVTARSYLGLTYAEQGAHERAAALLDEALDQATDAIDTWGMGHAHFFRGRLHELQKQWEPALAAYGAALETWVALNARVEQIESTAGLARIALAQGYGPDAFNLIETVLQHLAEHGPARLDEPLRVYWTIYRVLHYLQQEDEALEFLRVAHYMLVKQAEGLAPAQRAQFLDGVALNKRLADAWAQANSGS